MPGLNKKILLFLTIILVFLFITKPISAQECVPSYTECCADYFSKQVYEWDDGSGYCGEDACNIRDSACDPPPPPPPPPPNCNISVSHSADRSNAKVGDTATWRTHIGSSGDCSRDEVALRLLASAGLNWANPSTSDWSLRPDGTYFFSDTRSSWNIDLEWEGQIWGTCPQGRQSVYTEVTGGGGRAEVQVYGAVGCTLTNQTSSNITARFRVIDKFGGVQESGSFNVGPSGQASGPPLTEVNCSSGPFNADYSVNGGSWTRTESNFGITNGCTKQVSASYTGFVQPPPPGFPPPPPPPPPPQPPPDSSCDFNREYPQCGGLCNGITYPSNHTVLIQEFTDSQGAICRYECQDLGVISGQCGNGGSACTVSWTLSNENPPPGSNIQVKVHGLSDPQGWQNIELYLDSNPTGSWGGRENPWPTFVYNNIPTGSGGPHTLRFATNNGARTCTPPRTFITQSPPPTCSNTSPGNNQLKGCLFDGTNFNTPDGNAPDGVLLSSPVADIPSVALDQDWGNSGPNGFVGSDTFSSRWRGNFTFKQGTYTFYAGADDGVRLKIGGVEKIDIPPGTSWKDQGYTLYSAQVTFTTQTTTLVEVEYYENGGHAKVTLAWSYTPPPPPTSAWIQVTGDVHSNTRIRLPGGPP